MSHIEHTPNQQNIFPLNESVRQQVTQEMERLEHIGIDVATLERMRFDPELKALIDKRTESMDETATSSYGLGAAYLHMVLRGHCSALPQLPPDSHKVALANIQEARRHFDGTEQYHQARKRNLFEADEKLKFVTYYGEVRMYEVMQASFVRKERLTAELWFREAVFDTYELYRNYYMNRGLADIWHQ